MQKFVNWLLGMLLLMFLWGCFAFASGPSFFPRPSNDLPPNLCTSSDFWSCANNIAIVILRLIMFLAIVFATISIAWSGVLYITKGSSSKEEVSKIHLRITWAIIGLVVALSSYVIIKVIEGSILRNRIFPLLPKPAIAVSVSSPPTGLKCGSKVLPSIFSPDDPEREIWKDCLWYYVELVMIFLYRLAIALAVIFIAWAGLLYILQPEKTKEIHRRLIWGIIGAVIAILSFTIVRLIETFILTIT